MTLISDDYRRLNAELHGAEHDFGTALNVPTDQIVSLIKWVKARSVIDYGADKGRFAGELRAAGFDVVEYDPCIPEKAAEPGPADFLVCIDVLEHIEPEYLDNMLRHISGLYKIPSYLLIPTGPAKKTLPDGRNAHLTVQPAEWWAAKIGQHMQVVGSGSITYASKWSGKLKGQKAWIVTR